MRKQGSLQKRRAFSGFQRIAPLFLGAALTLIVGFSARAEDFGTVTGTLTEPDGTTPVANASVTLHTSSWSHSQYLMTGSDGAFSFSGVPAGSYQLDIWSNHQDYFSPASPTLTVTAGQTTALGVVQLINPNFFCKVTLPDGVTPVSNASVTIRTADWSTSKYMSTDASGNCKNALTVNGTYIVEVYTYHELYSRPANLTIVYSGTPVYLDGTNGSSVISMQAPSMRGQVNLPGGGPAQYANVNLRDSTGIGVQWASTDSNGQFKIDALPTGTYTLDVDPPSTPSGLAAPDPFTVTLTAGTTNTTYLTTPIVLTQSVKTISVRVRRSSGAAVTDANVSAWKYMGGGWGSGTVDSSGNLSLVVSEGGSWQISVYPTWSSGVTPDWTHDGAPVQATFTQPNSVAETITVDFTVSTFSATLTGSVLFPDGTPVPNSEYWSVNAWRDYGSGNWAQVVNGSYTMRLAPGTYHVSVNGSMMDYGAPEYTISVEENETVTQNVTLLARSATLNVTVRDTNGRAIPNQSCNAWKREGSGWGWGTTDSNGVAQLRVTPGTWYVSCYPSGGSTATSLSTIQSTSTSYVSTSEPEEVSVAANGTVNLAVVFEIADATIAGKLVDPNGTPLTNIWGWVEARKPQSSSTTETFHYGGLGGSVSAGTFNIRVPGGTWVLGASLGYGMDYTASTASSKEITIASGETKNDVELALVPNNATVSGCFKDTAGNTLTSVYGSVFADNGTGGYQWASLNQGCYQLKAPAGELYFGCWVDYSTASQYYMDGTCESKVTAVANQTTPHDVTLKTADSTITVNARDPDGNPLGNALVSINTSFGTTKTVSYGTYGMWFDRNNYTDQNGQVVLNVPAGTYFVSASLSPELGFINPEREVVAVTADAPATVTLTFRRPNATITGTVTKDNTAYTGEPLVYAWSDKGAYTETHASTTGSYSLPVVKEDNETWHVGVADQSGTSGYRSDEEESVTIPDSGTATAGLELDSTATLAKAITTTTNTNTALKVTVGSAELNAPQNTFSSSNVSVVVEAAPTVEVPNSATDSLVDGVAYNLKVTQSSGSNAGQAISKFAGDATVCIPYSESTLTTAGLSEDDLTAKFWNEGAGTYDAPKTVTVNKDTNKVCVTTDHFTKFVLTSAPVEQKRSTTPGSPGDGGTGPDDAPIIGADPDVIELTTKQLAVLVKGTGKTPGPKIYLYNADGTLARTIQPYGTKTAGDFNVVAVDLTGDGQQKLVVWDSSGRGLPVKVFTLAGTTYGSFKTTKGKRAAVTPFDADGNGAKELALTAQNDRSVTIYRVASGKLAKSLAFKNAAAAGQGLSAVAGNVYGTANEELVLTTVGGTASLKAFAIDLNAKKATVIAKVNDASLVPGVTVILADLTGTSVKELITAGKGALTARAIAKGKFTRLGKAVKYTGSLGLATADFTGDGKQDILLSSGTSSLRLLTVKKGALAAQATGKLKARLQLAGDYDADGTAEAILSEPNTPTLKVVKFSSGKLATVASLTIGSRRAKTPLGLAAIDLDGDGRREIVATAQKGTPIVSLVTFRQGKTLTLSKQLKPSGKQPYTVAAASIR